KTNGTTDPAASHTFVQNVSLEALKIAVPRRYHWRPPPAACSAKVGLPVSNSSDSRLTDIRSTLYSTPSMVIDRSLPVTRVAILVLLQLEFCIYEQGCPVLG